MCMLYLGNDIIVCCYVNVSRQYSEFVETPSLVDVQLLGLVVSLRKAAVSPDALCDIPRCSTQRLLCPLQ